MSKILIGSPYFFSHYDDFNSKDVLITQLGDKHKYEEIIYNSYLENGSFTLINEQRKMAYKSYKESRGA